jgi:hypothetical protein
MLVSLAKIVVVKSHLRYRMLRCSCFLVLITGSGVSLLCFPMCWSTSSDSSVSLQVGHSIEMLCLGCCVCLFTIVNLTTSQMFCYKGMISRRKSIYSRSIGQDLSPGTPECEQECQPFSRNVRSGHFELCALVCCGTLLAIGLLL